MPSSDQQDEESDANQDSSNLDPETHTHWQHGSDSESSLHPQALNSEKDQPSSKKFDLSSLLESLKDTSYNYQYLDHPADVILLGEGESIKDALQSVAISLFNYMSDLSYVNVSHHKEFGITARGLLNLLYHFLDECLYLYSSEYFIAKHVLIQDDVELPPTHSEEHFNNHNFNLKAIALGDYYNKNLHKSGTEVKAITMHYLNFNLWIGDQCYEYKNDMESHDQTSQLLAALKRHNNSISKCKVFALVDI